MAKAKREDINPDDYLEIEIGYDLHSGSGQEEEKPESKRVDRTGDGSDKKVGFCNPDDFLEAELGYEMDNGDDICS